MVDMNLLMNLNAFCENSLKLLAYTLSSPILQKTTPNIHKTGAAIFPESAHGDWLIELRSQVTASCQSCRYLLLFYLKTNQTYTHSREIRTTENDKKTVFRKLFCLYFDYDPNPICQHGGAGFMTCTVGIQQGAIKKLLPHF